MSEGWAMIATMCVVCTIMCYLYMTILRKLVRPLVYLGSVLLFVTLVTVGSVAAFQAHKMSQCGKTDCGEEDYVIIAVISFVCAASWLVVFVALHQQILLSCSILEEASKVVQAAPQILLIPLVQSVFMVLLTVLFTFVSVNVYTSTSPMTSLTGVVIAVSPEASATLQSSVVYQPDDYRGVGQFYTIFMWLWTTGALHASATCLIALVAGQWFWSAPGDHKYVPVDATRWSVWTMLRYHMGSVFFGSFLIALVQFSRFILNLAEKRLRKITQSSELVHVLLCVAECLLAFYERIVRYVTKHAYVTMALLGRPLISSARVAFDLLLGDVKVMLVDMISDVMISVGKFVIVGFTLIMGFVWMRQHATIASTDTSDSEDQNFIVVLVVLAILAYFITSLFATVFHVSVDTILLSYCLDQRICGGAYTPDALRAFVEATAAAKSKQMDGASPEMKVLLRE